MTDEFLSTLSRQWQQGGESAGISVAALRWQRKTQKRVLALELAAAAIAIAAGLGFFFFHQGVVFDVAAFVLLASGIHGSLFSYRLRRQLTQWMDQTPEGVLRYRLRACESAIRNARYAALSALVLALFVVFVWFAGEMGAGNLPEGFRALYASIALPIIVGVLLWSRWRIAKKRQECRLMQKLLGEFSEPGKSPTAE